MKEYVLNQKEPLTSQQPKKVVYIEMFKAGPQISSTGQKMMFTEEDLDQVIQSYDPNHHEAPLIIGHDQDDGTPALGWVREVWRKGQNLWGKVELTPKAEKLIRDGEFKKVSSSFYLPEAETNPTPGRLSLRHLGLVSIPAVKGLTAFSELGEETITITPSGGESSISFKENLGKNQIMARKKTKPEAPTTATVEHGEGGMTVNINIGSGSTGANVYDDSGNKVSETGAPAEYDMDYGMDAEPAMMSMADDTEMPDDDEGGDGGDMPPAPEGDEESDDDMPPAPEEDEEGGDMPDADGDEGGDMSPAPRGEGDEAGGPSMETDDISGDMEGEDEKIAQLASEYEIEDLIKALALKTETSSMMEDDMSYGEMPEGLKKAIEAKKEGEGEDEDEKKESEDMGETVSEAEKPSGAGEPPSEDVKGAEEPKGETVYAEEEASKEEDKEEYGEGCDSKYEEKKEDEEKKMKADMSEEEESSEATGTLDHSEKAMGVHGNDLQARVAELEEELARQKKLMREKEIGDFCETLYTEAKLTEQIVPKIDLVRFMETLNSKNSVNFSEAGRTSQFDFFKGVLQNLPSMVSFEEMATQASSPKSKKVAQPSASGYVYDPNTADVHFQALAYAEKKGTDYTTALKEIIIQNEL